MRTPEQEKLIDVSSDVYIAIWSAICAIELQEKQIGVTKGIPGYKSWDDIKQGLADAEQTLRDYVNEVLA